MTKLLLWCVLLVLFWPLAVLVAGLWALLALTALLVRAAALVCGVTVGAGLLSAISARRAYTALEARRIA